MLNKGAKINNVSSIGVSLLIVALNIILLSWSLFFLIDSFGCVIDIHQCAMIVVLSIALGGINLGKDKDLFRNLAVRRLALSLVAFSVAAMRMLIYW